MRAWEYYPEPEKRFITTYGANAETENNIFQEERFKINTGFRYLGFFLGE